MPSGRSIRAGAAFLELRAKDGQMVRALQRSRRMLNDFGAAAQRVGRGLVAGGAGIVAPLALATRMFAKFGDQMDKMTIRTGIGAESLSELKFAAEQSGASIDDLEGALTRMNRRLGRIAAGQGSTTQTEALASLGLTREEIQRLSPEERFLAIADAMSEMEDQTVAAGLAQRAFGTEVDSILPLMLQGRDGIRELKEEARRLGLTISQDSASRAAELTDELNILSSVARRLAFSVGDTLQPSAMSATGAMIEAAAAVSDWVQRNRELVVIAAKVGGALLIAGGAMLTVAVAAKVAAFAIGPLIGAISLLGTVVGVAGGAIAALLSPMGLLLAAVVGLGAAIFTQTNIGSRALDFIAAKFGDLAEIAREAFGGIVDALQDGNFELAADIAMKGLKLAWLEGTRELRSVWGDFEDWMNKSLVKISGKVTEFGTGLISKITGFVSENATALSAAAQGAAQERNGRLITQGTADAISKAINQNAPLLGGISNVTGAISEGMGDHTQAQLDAIDRRSEDRERALNAEISKLTKELGELTDQAENGGDGAGDGGRKGAGELLREFLDKAGDQGPTIGSGAQTRIAAGTTAFQSLLGGGGVFDKINTASQQTAKNTKQIARRMAEGATYT